MMPTIKSDTPATPRLTADDSDGIVVLMSIVIKDWEEPS
jgi:hypothetical protein